MTKQLLLCLAAATLVIAPGCGKRTNPTYREITQVTPYWEEKVEILDPEQLEKDRSKLKKRGIILTATAPIVAASGVGASYAILSACPYSHIGVGIFAALILCPLTIGGGIYMLGQGIHDLAKAKKLRRIQMKDAAQKRQAAREAQRAQAA